MNDELKNLFDNCSQIKDTLWLDKDFALNMNLFEAIEFLLDKKYKQGRKDEKDDIIKLFYKYAKENNPLKITTINEVLTDLKELIKND